MRIAVLITIVSVVGTASLCTGDGKTLYLSSFVPEQLTIIIRDTSGVVYEKVVDERRTNSEDERILALQDCATYLIQVNEAGVDLSTCGDAMTYVLILHTPEDPYVITEFDEDYWIRD